MGFSFVFFFLVSSGSFADPVVSDASVKKLNELYDIATTDSVIRLWIENRMKEVIKDPLDAEIDRLLNESPVAAELRSAVLAEVSQMISASYRQHLGNVAQALPGKDGQYQYLYDLVQEAAAGLNFSPESRRNIKVFVHSDPNMNAYTYSSGDDIHVVFFEGLLENMARNKVERDGITYFQDTGELKQVTGHELFHIKGRHIENRFMIFAIFYAVGENMIPPEVISQDKSERGSSSVADEAKDLLALQRAELKSALQFMSQNLVMHQHKQVQSDIVKNFAASIEKASKILRSKMGKKSLENLASKLYKSMNGAGVLEEGFDMKAFKRLQDDLKRLSRSQEASCDNAGYIVTKNHEASVMAYARLAGGKGVKYEAIMKQIRSLGELLNGSRAGDPYAPHREASHPETIFRAAQYDIFRHTDAFKIFSNPFRRALYDYLDLSRTLIELERRVKSREIMEISMRGRLNLNRESLTAFAGALSKWIEQAIMEELIAADAEGANIKDHFNFPILSEFSSVLQKILYADDDATALVSSWDLKVEMGKPRRLVQDLLKRINGDELKNAEFKETLSRLITDLVPQVSQFPHPAIGDLYYLLKACKKSA